MTTLKVHAHNNHWYIGLNPAMRGRPRQFSGAPLQIQAPRLHFDGLWNGENWLCSNYSGAQQFDSEADANACLAANGRRMEIAPRN